MILMVIANRISFGPLSFEEGIGFTLKGNKLELTFSEENILLILLGAAPCFLNKSSCAGFNSGLITTYVSRLRPKLKGIGIQCVRGVGYRLKLPNETNFSDQVIQRGSLVLDPGIFVVVLGEREIKLTPSEFKVLHTLMLNSPFSVSIRDLWFSYQEVEPLDTDLLVPKQYIYHIRKLLSCVESDIKIVTIPRKGYSLQLDQPQGEQNGH